MHFGWQIIDILINVGCRLPRFVRLPRFDCLDLNVGRKYVCIKFKHDIKLNNALSCFSYTCYVESF